MSKGLKLGLASAFLFVAGGAFLASGISASSNDKAADSAVTSSEKSLKAPTDDQLALGHARRVNRRVYRRST